MNDATYRIAFAVLLCAVGGIGRADDKAPFVTDRAAIDKYRSESRAYFFRTMAKGFDAGNRKGAPGTAEGRAALERCAEHFSYSGRPERTMEAGDAHLKAAVEAGCKDPLVRYYRMLFEGWMGKERAEDATANAVAEDAARSAYPAARKMFVFHMAANEYDKVGPLPAERRAALVARWRKEFWDAFGQAAADRDPYAEDEVLNVVGILLKGPKAHGETRDGIGRRVAAALAAAGAPEYVRRTAAGTALVHAAMSALDEAPPAGLPAERAAAARAQLAEARAALEGAWAANPKGARSATAMLSVCRGLALPRDEMETWFGRAVRADPDNAAACGLKMDYLEPRWSGSVAAMTEFARQCRESGNWDGLIPQTAVLGYGAIRDKKYQSDIVESDAGWKELQAVLAGWVEARPESRWARSVYVRYAFEAKRYDVALREALALKDRPWPNVFPPREFGRLVAASRVLARKNVDLEYTRDGHYPRPYDDAGKRAFREGRRARYARLAGDAFAARHPATAKGHKEGVLALEAAARSAAIDFPNGKHADDAWAALDAAVGAGCDDALVRYLHARFGATTGQSVAADAADRLRKAADALIGSEYPAAFRMDAALQSAVGELGGDDPAKGFADRMAKFWPAFKEAAGDANRYAQEEVLKVAVQLIEADGLPGLTRAGTSIRIKAALEGAEADPYQELVLTGMERVTAAWDARGGGLSNTVTPEQFEAFFARLAEAEDHLAAAWRFRPERFEAPTQMIVVCMGRQQKRKDMEKWFERAMVANPDNADAFRRRATYLEPKWYGSKTGFDLFAAINEARTYDNCEAGFGKVHLDLQATADVDYRKKKPGDPEGWAKYEFAFDQFWLKRAPDCRYAKTVFALTALQFNKFKRADGLFKQLGDKPWPGVFPSREVYLKVAAAVAKKVKEDVD